MIVKTFQPRFHESLRSGAKLTTIRPMPANIRHYEGDWRQCKRVPKVGDKISLRAWSSLPYRSKQIVLRESVITEVSKVLMNVEFIEESGPSWTFQINCVRLTIVEIQKLAWGDSFESAAAMFSWFEGTYRLPFIGIFLRWA